MMILFVFALFHLYQGETILAWLDLCTGVVILGAMVDLRVNKNVARAGDISIGTLFFFFLFYISANQNNDLGIIWTLFFPVYTLMIRGKSGLPFIFLFYAILFILAYANIGVWQNGEWSVVGFVRLVVASILITYGVYISEQARVQVDQRNRKLLKREKEYSAQLNEYKRELESKVEKTLMELSEQERIILRNSQLAEMGNMIGVIAHQLKQPLNAISIMNYGIKDAHSHDELDGRYLLETSGGIDRQIQHMSATIDDFRDFFNPNKQKKTFNVARAIEKSLELLMPQLTQNKIILERRLDGLMEVVGYESELQQALINLVHNARDVLTHNGITDPRIVLSCRLDHRNLPLVQVEDNGGGVPEGIKEKIFDSYFTTKEAKGTGIGLYLVRKIVEESFEGSVRLHNTGSGACFSLYLSPVQPER